MPADASIFGLIQPAKAQNPLADMAQMMQIQGAMGQNAVHDYTLRKAAREDSDTNALSGLYKTAVKPDGTIDRNALYTGAAQQGLGAKIPGLQKSFAEADEATAKLDTQKLAAVKQRTELTGQAAGWLKQNPTPENAAAFFDHLVQNGIMPPEQAAQGKAKVAAGASVAELADLAYRGALSTKDQLAKYETRNTGGTTDTLRIDPVSNKVEVASSVKNTQSPDSIASNRTSTENNKRTIEAENLRAGVNSDGSPADGGGLLSPESVANAAARYNMDGTLPPNLGRGTQGPRQTAQILNEAAKMAAANGNGPEAQRIAQLANKSSAQALNTLEKQQTMVGAFEKNFNKNADIALEMSQKVGRTGVPILNSWINAGKRAVAGDADLAAFDANIKATVNEYAKIVGGGTGGGATAQGEIHKIEALLSAAQTPEQVQSVITLMKRETANRMSAFEDQKAELKRGMVQQKPAAAPATSTTPAGRTVTRTGMLNGKKVVQYSDGTTDYAN